MKYKLIYSFSFILLTAICALFVKHYFIEKGKVHIYVRYQAFANEDLSLYWNNGKGFSEVNFITLKTKTGPYEYDFVIDNCDTVKEIRLDPDSDSDLALLENISIKGLTKPFHLKEFSDSNSNGIKVYAGPTVTVLQRKKNNHDPYLIIPIPDETSRVLPRYTWFDFVIYSVCPLFSFLFLRSFRKKIDGFILNASAKQASLIILFICITSVYWSNTFLLYYTAPPNIENRKLAKKPNSDSIFDHPKKYFSDFNSWFSDHFYFKQALVYSNSLLKIEVFKTSPMPENMYIGKDFEFFSANSLLNDDVLGKRRLNKQELTSMFATTLFKQQLLANQHISYYLTIPPSKQTTYEDKLPEGLALQKKSGKMAEQFDEEIKAKKANFYINVIQPLSERHAQYPQERVFYQYDLHWSDWGAFLAYQELMKRIAQDHPWVGNVLRVEDFKMDTVYSEDADLAKLILMHRRFKKEKYTLKPAGDSIIETVVNGVYTFPMYKYKNKKAKGRALIFRDSYSEQWKWLIARHFNESIFIWDQHITQQLINEYKPDIVIQENCEMFLFYLLNPMSTHE